MKTVNVNEFKSNITDATSFALGYTQAGNLLIILRSDDGSEKSIGLSVEKWNFFKNEADKVVKDFHLQ